MSVTSVKKESPMQSLPEAEKGFSPRDFRNAMGQFATGVVVISNEENSEAHAMTANAFMSGSLEPPLVVVSVAHTARMHEKFQRTEMFGVSILSGDQLPTSNHFAGRVTPDYHPTFDHVLGVPVIKDAPVRVIAELRHAYPCGDHTLFVGEVQRLEVEDQPAKPLLFHSGRYADLVILD